MNLISIISAILTSSLISASLTAWVNWIIQKNNYKKDYYKKLLEKRLDTYESVEILVGNLKSLVHVKNDLLCNLFIYLGKEEYSKFKITLSAVIMRSLWLSNKLNCKLTELNVFLIQEIDYKVNKKLNYNEELIRLGVLNRDKIKLFREELEQILYNDFSNMHDIKSFIKCLRPNKTFALYDEKNEVTNTI